MRIEFTVPAVPVAQPRPRATMRNGRSSIHEVTHIKKADGTRKPHPIAAFKATVRLAAERAYRSAPIEGPINVRLVFVMPRPKGLVWKLKAMPRLRHTKAPDADNLFKSTTDALKGLTWIDDTQICVASIEKWIAAGDEQPHVRVTIEELAVVAE